VRGATRAVLEATKGVFGELPEDALSIGENHEGHVELSPRLQNLEAQMPQVVLACLRRLHTPEQELELPVDYHLA
jgi:hypothetical protein